MGRLSLCPSFFLKAQAKKVLGELNLGGDEVRIKRKSLLLVR